MNPVLWALTLAVGPVLLGKGNCFTKLQWRQTDQRNYSLSAKPGRRLFWKVTSPRSRNSTLSAKSSLVPAHVLALALLRFSGWNTPTLYCCSQLSNREAWDSMYDLQPLLVSLPPSLLGFIPVFGTWKHIFPQQQCYRQWLDYQMNLSSPKEKYLPFMEHLLCTRARLHALQRLLFSLILMTLVAGGCLHGTGNQISHPCDQQGHVAVSGTARIPNISVSAPKA